MIGLTVQNLPLVSCALPSASSSLFLCSPNPLFFFCPSYGHKTVDGMIYSSIRIELDGRRAKYVRTLCSWNFNSGTYIAWNFVLDICQSKFAAIRYDLFRTMTSTVYSKLVSWPLYGNILGVSSLIFYCHVWYHVSAAAHGTCSFNSVSWRVPCNWWCICQLALNDHFLCLLFSFY
jgi:hypothetical protein